MGNLGPLGGAKASNKVWPYARINYKIDLEVQSIIVFNTYLGNFIGFHSKAKLSWLTNQFEI